MTEQELMDMKLHEGINIYPECVLGNETYVQRVLGGWIYRDFSLGTSTFVPEPKKD